MASDQATGDAKPVQRPTPHGDLIFDIGFHEGHDAAFYLAKGFRVVGVEANPALCAQANGKYRDAIADGRLTVVNKAIDRKPGKVTLYVPERSDWSSLDPDFPSRHGGAVAVTPVDVEAVTMAQLVETYGAPYFVKIDIEGHDMAAVEGLKGSPVRPALISLESERDSFKGLQREIEALVDLGYDRFKVVNQRTVPDQKAPSPAREGSYVDYKFGHVSSGLFGDEAPGEWLTAEQAIEAYRRIFWHYALLGDFRVAPKWAQSLAWRLGVRCHWWDTHAKHSTAR
ncbi:MAG: FkbM family methyltransferase [Caulobacteraceae bacterium]